MGKWNRLSNLRMKVMPNFNALLGDSLTQFCFTETKKTNKNPTKNKTCLEKNDKCQQTFINLHLFFVVFLHTKYIGNSYLLLLFLKNHCGFASLCCRPRSICSRDLSGQCSGKSFDQLWRSNNNVPPMHDVLLGVIVRCSIRDIRQNPVLILY